MRRKPKVKLPPEKQSRQFVETARSLGVDESGKAFERAFDAIALVKQIKVKKNKSR